MKNQERSALSTSAYEQIVAEILNELNRRREMIKGEFSYNDIMKRTYPPVFRDLDRLLFPKQKAKILEIGTFSGVISLGLKKLGYAVVALDLPEYIAQTELLQRFAEFDIPTMAANLRDARIPAEDESFDCVVMCEVIEHFNFNPLPVLMEINRVLRPGGFLYLTTPNATHIGARVKCLMARSTHEPIRAFLWQLDPSGNYLVGLHWREYTGSEIKELLELPGLGFRVEQLGFRMSVNPRLEGRHLQTFLCRLFPGFRPTLYATAKKTSRSNLPVGRTEAAC